MYMPHNKDGKRILRPAKNKLTKYYKPYMGQNLDGKKILFFRTGGIGDLLFIKPIMDWMKEKYPTCHITMASGSPYVEMTSAWSCVDLAVSIPFNLIHFVKADYHVLYEGILERNHEAEKVNAYELFAKWTNVYDQMVADNAPMFPELYDINQKTRENAVAKLNELGIGNEGFILIQTRASSIVRTPSYRVWVKIITALQNAGHKVVLTDNNTHVIKINEFIDKLPNKENVFNIAGTSLHIADMIETARLAKLVIGTDSALMHVAAGVDTPCLGIYGAFIGEMRLGTYPKADWVDCKDEKCVPCFSHQEGKCSNACEDGAGKCYENLDVNVLVEKVEKLLKSHRQWISGYHMLL